MGESFGHYTIGHDEEILKYVTSANIACGFHAGDPTTMRKTVILALQNDVAIGAHPGLQDLIGFGRRVMDITAEEVYNLVVYQIGALSAFVKTEGGYLQHVKAHGALYNMAVKNKNLAEAIAKAVYKVDPDLILFGPVNSELIHAGKKFELRTASEVFADRTYQQDSSLTPRRQPNALIENHQVAVQQAVRMVKEQKVMTRQGIDIDINAETVCIHGDGPHSLSFAQKIRSSFEESGIRVQAVGKTK